mmetsp:Transcript_1507/g.2176  ORF Transcript_1507/g.2176 Transcript_1507/m.2176 type:complete len:176 (-) Transcript_1507:225-752(-)|eukprot:CAMPEP_0167742606 /NCGR_PEP_ID=MMETSP0110_2-20121227/1529_1 /TAXON_ID=629695 /ORGANISM="Gymnochlora sp., Strain CCMP2014" /LENGTH=175 /DNA_ID=CAMNT_0007626835 /DNA_START=206 /DNA_END=733 /DNA_ORIENTATION=+
MGCVLCCCPQGLRYESILNQDPDWDGVELTKEEIDELSKQLGSDELNDIEEQEEQYDETVAELDNLEKELEDVDRPSKRELPAPQNLDPKELKEHIKASNAGPLARQKSKIRKISRREVQEIKEKTRTHLLKKEVKMRPTQEPDRFDIEALIEDEETAQEDGGWDADITAMKDTL